MKNLKYIFSLFLMAMLLGCNDDNDTNFIDDAAAPTDLSALFTIKHDNSGEVTIWPNGTGVTMYKIDFGDGSTETTEVLSGASANHKYAEGVYDVKFTGIGINGKETAYTQKLTVSFIAPENLDVKITPEPGNPFKINVTAKADFETYFEVFFGESNTETPVQINEDQIASHTYSAIGTYTIKVVAYSGGAANSEYTQTVVINNPILLPINFELPAASYIFSNFGNANSSVVNNPHLGAGNNSAQVGKLNKAAGAETWAGSFIELGQPLDFSVMKRIKIKVWSPQSGIVVKMKLENLADNTINIERDVTNTVANGWEVLTFDFTGVSTTINYQRLVVFFDFGNPGTGADYYFDDVEMASGADVLELPLTFESATLDYTFTEFGGAPTSVVANPHIAGINTSAHVATTLKANGAQTYAGSLIELEDPIDFSEMQKIKIKVWSPQAGKIVKLKLENLLNGGTINIEKDATTTVVNGWEELTYDFSGIDNAGAYQRLVFFFDFGNVGTGATYYFDDIKLSN